MAIVCRFVVVAELHALAGRDFIAWLTTINFRPIRGPSTGAQRYFGPVMQSAAVSPTRAECGCRLVGPHLTHDEGGRNAAVLRLSQPVEKTLPQWSRRPHHRAGLRRRSRDHRTHTAPPRHPSSANAGPPHRTQGRQSPAIPARAPMCEANAIPVIPFIARLGQSFQVSRSASGGKRVDSSPRRLLMGILAIQRIYTNSGEPSACMCRREVEAV